MVKLTIEEIKKRREIVCICKAIPMLRIWEAIDAGCQTVEEVNQKAGTGQGGCGGTRCGPRIVDILKERIRKE